MRVIVPTPSSDPAPRAPASAPTPDDSASSTSEASQTANATGTQPFVPASTLYRRPGQRPLSRCEGTWQAAGAAGAHIDGTLPRQRQPLADYNTPGSSSDRTRPDASQSSGNPAFTVQASNHANAPLARLPAHRRRPLPLPRSVAPALPLVPPRSGAAPSSSMQGDASPARDLLASQEVPSEAAEQQFEADLIARGWRLVVQEGDGNCFFRAVSVHVYGDAGMHADIRRQCIEFMRRDRDHFSGFVTEGFEEYLARKERDGQCANNPEVQAVSELFNRPVEVYVPEQGAAAPINIFHSGYAAESAPIRVSYHGRSHYNAIVDPAAASVGQGLGLPGLSREAAEKEAFDRGLEDSKAAEVEKAALKVDLLQSDLEATEAQLEEEAILASLQSANPFVDALSSRFHAPPDDQPAPAAAAAHSPREHDEHRRNAWKGALPPGQIEPPAAAAAAYARAGRGGGGSGLSNSSAGGRSGAAARAVSGGGAPSRPFGGFHGAFGGNGGGKPVSPHGTGRGGGGGGGAGAGEGGDAKEAAVPASFGAFGGARAGGSHNGGSPVRKRRRSRSPEEEEDTAQAAISLAECPQSVRELVFNGFSLPRVMRVYSFVGDDFDAMLLQLMSGAT